MSSPVETAETGAGDSWYLDPLVARQKAFENRSCVDRWAGDRCSGRILKTDLFEEANGQDHVMTDLPAPGGKAYGVDMVASTVSRAAKNFGLAGSRVAVADLRQLPFRAGTFDLIFSTSTLDHFEADGQIERALAQLAMALAPGGRLIVTLDNPWNPLYWPLRIGTQQVGPFSLGRTMSRRRLTEALSDLDLEIVGGEYLIHNPRLVSTLLFLALRRLLGRRADGLVRALMTLFAWGGRLPTKAFTGSFVAVCAEKPRR